MKSMLIIVMSVFLISIVSANGLTITPSSFSINKTFNIDKEISFVLKNEEDFTFYNITFENNNYIKMPKISQLLSGESINITSTVFTDSEYFGDIKILGFYETNVGILNETHLINVDYNNGIDICDFTVLKGDKVTWINLVNDEIVLRNAGTGNDVTTIFKGDNYTFNFDVPEVFSYYFLRHGFIFTDICEITSLDNQGLINNPKFNTKINLNINVEYEPTNLSMSILQTNYTMDFNAIQEGILSVTNTGDIPAKGIHFNGDWFIFTPNDFDLDPGYSKAVSYTINPLITNVNDTNKFYYKNITVSGNFQSLVQTFSIFINYAPLEEINGTGSSLIDTIKWWCEQHPEDSLCPKGPIIIYRNVNESDRYFNVTMGESQLKELFDLWFNKIDTDFEFQNFVKEKFDIQESRINGIKNMQSNSTGDLNSILEKIESSNNVFTFFGLFMGSIIAIGLLTFLILNEKSRNKIKNWNRW